MKNKGPLYVLTCYVIWGLLPIFWKLLAQVDSLYVLASRIVWSMVLTGGILLLDRLAGVRAAFRDRREWGLLAAAGCVVCVNWGVYIWAVANGHMIDSSLAYYMNPILAILLGTTFFTLHGRVFTPSSESQTPSLIPRIKSAVIRSFTRTSYSFS